MPSPVDDPSALPYNYPGSTRMKRLSVIVDRDLYALNR